MTSATTRKPDLALYAQIKDHISRKIQEGIWRAGDRLPSENDLVTQFGMSRMTVNRALRELGVKVDLAVAETEPFVDVVASALGLPALRVVETGGTHYDSERQQWDSGNNLVAVEPGVVFAYDRNTHTNALLRKAGVGGN